MPSSPLPETLAPAPPRRAVARRVVEGLRLLPVSAVGLLRVAGGRASRTAGATRRHLLHAVLGVLLGSVLWWLAWMAVLATVRGPFYGFVDAGPYDRAWGGPSLAGAWAAHAGVWVATVPVLALVWWGLVRLQIRLTEHLLGDRRAAWVVPVSVLVVLGAGVLVVAWVRQI